MKIELRGSFDFERDDAARLQTIMDYTGERQAEALRLCVRAAYLQLMASPNKTLIVRPSL